LLAAYAVNLAAPPPPSVTAIGIGALAGAALGVLLAWWVDRHRVNVGMQTGGIVQAN
jgi:ABC-type lipoprotein release transport system permease subunit